MARLPWTTPRLSDAVNGVPLATPVVANRGTDEEWRGPLAELLIANADDPLDLPELTASLDAGLVYVGGGGAATAFTVEAA